MMMNPTEQRDDDDESNRGKTMMRNQRKETMMRNPTITNADRLKGEWEGSNL